MYNILPGLTVTTDDAEPGYRSLSTRATFTCDYATLRECIGDPEPYGFIVPVHTPGGLVVLWRVSDATETPTWRATTEVDGAVVWLFARLPEGLAGWARAEGAHGSATLKGYVVALAEFLEVRATALADDPPLQEHTLVAARALRHLVEVPDLRWALHHLQQDFAGDSCGEEHVRAARARLAAVLAELLTSAVAGGPLRA